MISVRTGRELVSQTFPQAVAIVEQLAILQAEQVQDGRVEVVDAHLFSAALKPMSSVAP